MLKHLQVSLALLAFLGLATGPLPLLASNEPPPAEPTAPLLPPDQLDQLLAPIALYPDPLLAQILPAATQPGEVVMAHRYVKDGKDMTKIDAQPWDESVKALARYPDVLTMMDKQLDWTTKLGQAFIAQPSDIFASVQRLRAQAQSVGNLKTTPEQVVTTEQSVIQIMPANPQVIYVPQYQPSVVYVQQPVNVVAPLITFGAGLALGVWIHNSVNWHSNNIYYYNNGWNGHYPNGGWNNNYHGGGNTVNINNSNNINIGNGSGNGGGNVWKPQTKPKPNPLPGNGNGNGWNGGNKPGAGNGNNPGNGWNGGKPNQPPTSGNKPWGNGSQQKPSTLPGHSNLGNQQKPATRDMPTMPSGNQQFNREATKPNQNRPAQASRPAQANRQAPAQRQQPAQAQRTAPAQRQAPAAGAQRASGGGGGGGGRLQR